MSLILITTAAGILGTLGVGGIVVALINKRPDPFAQAQQIIDALQEERSAGTDARKADAEARERLESKLDAVYESLSAYRTYAADWELWYSAGMSDPPGRPIRPILLVNK